MYRVHHIYKWLAVLALIQLICIASCIPYPSQQVVPDSIEQSQSPPVEAESPVNQSPIIHNMQAQQEIEPSSSIQIGCVATDADEDELFYSWSADTGSLTGKGDTITWTAPQERGEYTITATVSDGNGNNTQDSVTIIVAPIINRYPSISLVVTPKGEAPINVMSTSDPITVRVWSVLEIECIASDPDNDKLDYQWYITEGKIDGEGAKVSYIAKGKGDQIITVAVTDSTGRKTVGNIRLRVKCCGSN